MLGCPLLSCGWEEWESYEDYSESTGNRERLTSICTTIYTWSQREMYSRTNVSSWNTFTRLNKNSKELNYWGNIGFIIVINLKLIVKRTRLWEREEQKEWPTRRKCYLLFQLLLPLFQSRPPKRNNKPPVPVKSKEIKNPPGHEKAKVYLMIK